MSLTATPTATAAELGVFSVCEQEKEYITFILFYLWAKYKPIWLYFILQTVIFSGLRFLRWQIKGLVFAQICLIHVLYPY